MRRRSSPCACGPRWALPWPSAASPRKPAGADLRPAAGHHPGCAAVAADRLLRRAVQPAPQGCLRGPRGAAAVGDRLPPGAPVPTGALEPLAEVGTAVALVGEVVVPRHVAGVATGGTLELAVPPERAEAL